VQESNLPVAMTFFDTERFEQLRQERGVTWGRPVRVHAQCTSTNDLALQAISTEAKTGIVFLAKEQTAGRGRRGQRWVAPPGECLMCSVLLRYPRQAPAPHGLSLAVGLALIDVVTSRVDPRHLVRLKWPNDVYVNDAKLAGILIESKPDAQGQLGLVIGMGLNVSTTSFPAELPHATSLSLLGARHETMEQLLVELLEALERHVRHFVKHGVAGLWEEANRLDYLAGKSICIDGKPWVGQGINQRGELIAVDEAGNVMTFASAHVELNQGAQVPR
jgi:BirA family biotin operon repressor/biotin-[acetyl-CoA-carboxylase] ligase